MKKANSNKALVSVILPVYKSEQYLVACLDSLLSQSYSNLEIVAVVDYLGDDSLKILKQYRKKDKRLKVYNNLQRYGLASTLNRAVGLAKGDFLAFMDSTGVADKTRLSKQVRFLEENTRVASVGSQVAIISDSNRRISESTFSLVHEEVYKHVLNGETFKFESAMVAKTRIPKDVIKFSKDKKYPFLFSEVFLKIGQYGELANLAEALVKTRDLKKNKSLRLDKKISFVKLLVESTANYEYKPSIKSIFSPILRQS